MFCFIEAFGKTMRSFPRLTGQLFKSLEVGVEYPEWCEMREVFDTTVKSLENEESCVLVSVVRTKGSTPQKPGAKLLVRGDGSATGTLGGGCVEGDIWFAARELLRTGGTAFIKDYFLNEELAARDGLVCGGTMYFLLDSIQDPKLMLSHMQEIQNAYEGGPAVGLATLLKPAQGSQMPIAEKILIRSDQTRIGTLGNMQLDNYIQRRLSALMDYGKSEFVTRDDGTEVFLEAFTTPPQLVVMGGGHIAKCLSDLSVSMGFALYVIDDRPEFANQVRFPNAVDTIVSSYDEGLTRVPVSRNTFIVIATRGHQFDDIAAETAALSQAGYVGLLGSNRKCLMIYEALFKRGIPEELIRRIRGPVGLDLGGRTPEEIALSIMAEITMERFGGEGRPMTMTESLFAKAKRKSTRISVSG